MVMKKFLLGIISIFVLASCQGDLPSLDLSALRLPSSHGEFYSNLSNEYKNLATFEREHMKHEDDADHFETKARRALRHQDVKPDDPSSREIPDFAIDELMTAFGVLHDALDNLNVSENASLLAMAQTRYDCWLAHQEDIPDQEAHIACKAGFYDALALLHVPEEDVKVFPIYFDSASTDLDTKAKQTIGEIAVRYVDRPHWAIVLKGFSDPTGDKRSNKTLSMRRAVAVKNTLGQYGLNLANIAISAEGEVEEGEDEQFSRRVEVKAWPQYVAQNKNGLALAPGWSHSLSQ